MLLCGILRKSVYTIHPFPYWIPEAKWKCRQDYLWIQNTECGPLAHHRSCSCGYWQYRPGIWHWNWASLFHVTEAQKHRQWALPSMTTTAAMRTATNDHHRSQELCLFEVDPETLEAMAGPVSAFVHTVWSAWPPDPSEYLFYLQSSSLIDLKYFSIWQFRFQMTNDNDHLYQIVNWLKK